MGINIVATVILLLFVVTAVLFIRSLGEGDVISRYRFDASGAYVGVEGFIVTRGRVVFQRGRLDFAVMPPPAIPVGWRFSRWPRNQPLAFKLSRSGFQSITFRYGMSAGIGKRPIWDGTMHAEAFPLYPLLVLLAIPLCLWVIAHRRQARRELEGKCPNCGYDLRATSDRCPECGMIPREVAPQPNEPNSN